MPKNRSYTSRRGVTHAKISKRKKSKKAKSALTKKVAKIAKRVALGTATVRWVNSSALSLDDGTTGLSNHQNVPALANWKVSRVRDGGRTTGGNNLGNLMPMWDHVPSHGDTINSYEGNEPFILGFKYNFFLRAGAGASAGYPYPVRIIHGWFKQEDQNATPNIYDIVSSSITLPKAGSSSDGNTSAIAGGVNMADARANVWFPWTLSSSDGRIQNRSNYKILGNKQYMVRKEGGSTDSRETRECVLSFYFDVRRKIQLQTSGWSYHEWTPFIFFYTSEFASSSDLTLAKVVLSWESRAYWKNP